VTYTAAATIVDIYTIEKSDSDCFVADPFNLTEIVVAGAGKIAVALALLLVLL